MRQITEEQWIDGPRVSRAKVAEARHLMREVNHVKQCETWVDGPKSQSCRSLTAGNLPTAAQTQGYGFMDAHKKTMIRQWVENQTTQVFQGAASVSASCSPTALHLKLSQLKQKSLDLPERPLFQPEATLELPQCLDSLPLLSSCPDAQPDGDDQDSGPSEVPPALPLLDDPLGSRDISHDSLHRMLSRHDSEMAVSRASSQHPSQRSIDCGLQVTEEEIARTMARSERERERDRERDREREREREREQTHPLTALSHCDNLSFVSSFNMACESFSECGERAR